jgi:hypothetical protein
MSLRFLQCVKVQNNAFGSSFVLKSEKPERKRINYCSKHMVKMGRTQVYDWFCRFKEVRTSVESNPRSGRPSKIMLLPFCILRVLYTSSTLPTGK